MVNALDDLTIEIIRTRPKKTISMRVRDGCLYVRAPRRVPNYEIHAFIKQQHHWITKQLLLQAAQPKIPKKNYTAGEHVTYLGKDYRLAIQDAAQKSIVLTDNELIVFTPHRSTTEHHNPSTTDQNFKEKHHQTHDSIRKKPHHTHFQLKTEGEAEQINPIQQQVKEWLQDAATTLLTQKTLDYAKHIGVTPKSVTVRAYKSQWGSCSPDGRIRYNVKLIAAPEHIIDYVVVHELCHMHHHNHSPAYWACVAAILPHHKECRKWLRMHGKTLDTQDI